MDFQDSCVCAAAEVGRDAVRTPQAHPSNESPASARSKRRMRRAPPHRHHAKPLQDGEADPHFGSQPLHKRDRVLDTVQQRARPDLCAQFFNTIHAHPDRGRHTAFVPLCGPLSVGKGASLLRWLFVAPMCTGKHDKSPINDFCIREPR